MNRTRARRLLLLVLLLAIGIYAPTVGNRFAQDDRWIVASTFDDGRSNDAVLDAWGTLVRPYWGAVDQRVDPLYRPLTSLSYALVYAGAGRPLARSQDEAGEALPQHLVNLLFYVLGVWLCWRLARSLRLRRGPALCAALAFAVHAVHHETVALVVGRAELLAFCFGAAVLLLARRATRGRLVAAAFCALGAFASKESGLVWAPILAIYLIAARRPAGGPAVRRGVRDTLLVTAVPALVYVTARTWVLHGLPVQPTAPSINPLAWLGMLERAPAALQVWGHALFQLVWPFELRADYSVPVFDLARDFGDLRALGGLAAVVAILIVGVRARHRAPVLSVAAAVTLGFGFVVSNLALPIGTIYGERLAFTPSLGACLLAGWLGADRRRHLGRLGQLAFAAWVVACVVTVLSRNGVFHDDETLFAHESARTSASARAHYSQAKICERRGEIPGMTRHLTRAVQLDPQLGVAWNDLAVHWIRVGRRDDARAAIAAGLVAINQDDDTRYLLHKNAASLSVTDGELAAARGALLQLIAIDEDRLLAEIDGLYDAYGDIAPFRWLDETLEQLEASARSRPSWLARRGRLSLRAGRFEEAEDRLGAAVAQLPDGEERHLARFWLAATQIETGKRTAPRQLLEELLRTPDLDADLRDRCEQLLQVLR